VENFVDAESPLDVFPGRAVSEPAREQSAAENDSAREVYGQVAGRARLNRGPDNSGNLVGHAAPDGDGQQLAAESGRVPVQNLVDAVGRVHDASPRGRADLEKTEPVLIESRARFSQRERRLYFCRLMKRR
jgi:hypothetical protein